jgi:hypothetical protein
MVCSASSKMSRSTGEERSNLAGIERACCLFEGQRETRPDQGIAVRHADGLPDAGVCRSREPGRNQTGC